MGFFDTFKGNQYKAELEQLQLEHESLKALMTPEMQDAFMLKQEIARLQSEQISQQKQIDDLNLTIASKNSDINALDSEIQRKKKEIVWMDDEILVQEFGLYKPQFEFASSLDYKEKLSEVRATQKELIKTKQAVTGNTQWEVNGSAAKGRKMVSDTQKLLLRAFNSECDELVSKVKYTNFDASLDKIYKLSEAISKLGAIMNISITQNYLNSKVKELRLAFEYQTKNSKKKKS